MFLRQRRGARIAEIAVKGSYIQLRQKLNIASVEIYIGKTQLWARNEFGARYKQLLTD